MESKKGKILTVTSMKGGVGKTTTTMMLANIYSRCGKKVLVIDLDLYNGNLAFAYNIKIKNTIYNLCDDMVNNRLVNGISNDYVYKVSDNLYFIPACKDPRQASKVDNRVLGNILNSLSYLYDVILIDTNHILNVCNMIAFEHSYKIINVFTNDSFDLQSTKSFVSICKNMEVDNLVLMLNNSLNKGFNYYTNYDIKNITKKNVDYTIPSNLYIKNFDQLVMDGKISSFDIKGDFRKNFDAFSEHMINLLEEGGKK